MSEFFDFPHRVTYAETDRMGYVYYGNYMTFFEIGRTELIRASGMTYMALEDSGYYLPVIESTIKYHKPARYDDLLVIRTRVSEFKGIRLNFDYEVVLDSVLMAEGTTKHAFVDTDGKPRKLPADMRELLSRALG